LRILAIILSGLAFLASIAATTYLLITPLYQHVETILTESGQETIQSTAGLVEVNGTRVVIQLLLVTLVSGVPLFVVLRRSTLQRSLMWMSALLLMAYSIAGIFTIGLAFMPAAILLLIAAIASLFIHKGADH
jgi:hypothetical protein